MKKLNVSQMETINGGLFDATGFGNGFCIGVGIVGLFTGVGAPLALGCIVWGISTW